MRGPTEFTTTIVLLLFAATAWTNASPLFHAVKLFLYDGQRRVKGFDVLRGEGEIHTYHLHCHPR